MVLDGFYVMALFFWLLLTFAHLILQPPNNQRLLTFGLKLRMQSQDSREHLDDMASLSWLGSLQNLEKVSFKMKKR